MSRITTTKYLNHYSIRMELFFSSRLNNLFRESRSNEKNLEAAKSTMKWEGSK